MISGKKEAGQKLSRWDVSKPATIDNLALFCKEEHEKHVKFGSLEEAGYGEDVQQRFREQAERAKKLYDSGYMMFI